MSSNLDLDTSVTRIYAEPVFLAQATCDPGDLKMPIFNVAIPK